jgi:hypothetical protein
MRTGSTWQYRICTAALPKTEDYWSSFSSLVNDTSNRLWAVIILRSGRFAGAIFEGND